MKTAVAILCFGLAASTGFGALVAYDDAADSAYNSAWGNGANGGSGFGAWAFANTSENMSQNGQFLATTSGNLDLSIDTSGRAWGLYAKESQTANAVRSFTGENPVLLSGQRFRINMDNASIDTGGVVGFSLRNSAHNNRFEFYFVGGQQFYYINANGTQTETSVPFTTSGLELEFTQGAGNAFSFTINGGTPYTGFLAGSDISEVRLFNYNAGNLNNVYFNEMEVTPVPEPTHIALGIFGALFAGGAAYRKLRQRRS